MSFDGVANFRRRYVTLWPWPLTRLNFWLSRVQNIGQYKIWGNRIIRGWITDNLTHFCRPILRGSLHGESQRCMQNGSRLGENIRIQEVRFWIANILLHFETRAAQRRMLSKNEAKFLPPPVQSRGGVGEMSEQKKIKLRLLPNLWRKLTCDMGSFSIRGSWEASSGKK